MTEITPDEAVLDAVEPPVPSVWDQYETDVAEQEGGRWFRNIGIGMDLKLRRYTSRVALNNVQRLQQAYRRFQLKTGQLPEDKAEQLMVEHLAGCIIVDWSGPAFRQKDSDETMPFSVETAKILMQRLPDLRTQVLTISMSVDNFRVSERKDIEGN